MNINAATIAADPMPIATLFVTSLLLCPSSAKAAGAGEGFGSGDALVTGGVGFLDILYSFSHAALSADRSAHP
jgi:hypothetical protein